jgi:hypothetical protein
VKALSLPADIQAPTEVEIINPELYSLLWTILRLAWILTLPLIVAEVFAFHDPQW